MIGFSRPLLGLKTGALGKKGSFRVFSAVERNLRPIGWNCRSNVRCASLSFMQNARVPPMSAAPEHVEEAGMNVGKDAWYVHRQRIETIRLKTSAQFYDYYDMDEGEADPLAYGSFGSIHVCTPRSVPNGQQVAVKIMHKINQPYYQREIEMLKRVNHANGCVKLLRILESPHKVFLVTELLEGRDLFDYIVDHNVALGTLTFKEALAITKNMLKALEVCHLENLAHLDVKPENFVFRNEVGEGDIGDQELVLVDFGAAQPFLIRPFARNHQSYQKGMDEFWMGVQETKITGTASYISPEIFLLNRFSSRSDMWSLGVSLYMMLTGERPFDSSCDKTIQKMVVEEAQGSREESIFANSRALEQNEVPDCIRDFLQELTEPQPEHRPSSSEALLRIESLLNRSDLI